MYLNLNPTRTLLSKFLIEFEEDILSFEMQFELHKQS